MSLSNNLNHLIRSIKWVVPFVVILNFQLVIWSKRYWCISICHNKAKHANGLYNWKEGPLEPSISEIKMKIHFLWSSSVMHHITIAAHAEGHPSKERGSSRPRKEDSNLWLTRPSNWRKLGSNRNHIFGEKEEGGWQNYQILDLQYILIQDHKLWKSSQINDNKGQKIMRKQKSNAKSIKELSPKCVHCTYFDHGPSDRRSHSVLHISSYNPNLILIEWSQ